MRTTWMRMGRVGLLACLGVIGLAAPVAVAQDPSPAPSSGPAPVTILTTCGSHAYPGQGIAGPIIDPHDPGPEAAALGKALLTWRGELPSWTGDQASADDLVWRLAGQDQTGILFLAALRDAERSWIAIEATRGGGSRSNIGDCRPRRVTGPAVGPADWWLDPSHPAPAPDATELDLLVLEQACASGASAVGRIAHPEIVSDETSVTITIGVLPAPGDHSCQGNPPTELTLPLPEPLGQRRLLDGSHQPPIPAAPPDAWSEPEVDHMDPEAVLLAYLAALVEGDCATASRFAAPTFVRGAGELCGHVTVLSATLGPGDPARPSRGELVYATTLGIIGDDPSLPDGSIRWFYSLQRQPDDRWLIAGGGTGP
ncbi:MAG: hypothetical protein KF809_09615 [Chloroflexi bacterium]|nr:hypothetical protein [Chloroflexota bacterium]